MYVNSKGSFYVTSRIQPHYLALIEKQYTREIRVSIQNVKPFFYNSEM